MSSRAKRKREAASPRASSLNVSEMPTKRPRLVPTYTFQHVQVPPLEEALKKAGLTRVVQRVDESTDKLRFEESTGLLSQQLAELDIGMQIVQEKNLLLPEGKNDQDEGQTIPIRYLDCFSVFDGETDEMISLDQVEEQVEKGLSAYFTGSVRPTFESANSAEDDEEEFTSILVNSSSIKNLWKSRKPERGRIVADRSAIWLETKFAWYILLKPSREYQELFIPVWLRHQLFLSMVYLSTMTEGRVQNVDRFRKRFLKNEVSWAYEMFGIELGEQDLKLAMPEVLESAFDDYEDENEDGETNNEDESAEQSQVHVTETPLFKALYAEFVPHLKRDNLPHLLGSLDTTKAGPSSPSRPKLSRPTPPGTSQRKDHSTETFCTPFIKSIVKDYFPGLQDDSEDTESDLVEGEDQVYEPIDLRGPQKSKIKCGPRGAGGNLEWVEVNGQKYRPRDTVFVRPHCDPNLQKKLIHPEALADHVWFAYIIRLFGSGKAHVIWFQHAKKTSLRELANSQELFLLDQCQDVDVDTFIGWCDNRHLDLDEVEPPSGTNFLLFFYRYLWLRNNDDAFLDADEYLRQRLVYTPTHTPCPSCNSTGAQNILQQPRITGDGVKIKDIEYHIDDFVYILPEQPRSVYIIGQITKIDCEKVNIRRFTRGPRPTHTNNYYDDRLLLDQTPDKIWPYATHDIEGKCVVYNASQARNLGEDEYFCHATNSLRHCDCWSSSSRVSISRDACLKAMDLFSGAGAFSLGLESTRGIETLWAVEIDPSSVLTFRDTHPKCTVYNTCVNSLLRHYYRTRLHGVSKKLKSTVNGTELPTFPKRNEVDIIIGGPPCQGFSRLNRFPKANDSRNYLMLSFLSAVDMLRPRYVVIENVRGLLTYRLDNMESNRTRLTGGIAQGMMKVIKRVLTAMNYQVRYGLLHAAHYGVPQDRRRIIFVAALRGLFLPELPQPSHLCTKSQDLAINVDSPDSPQTFTVNRRRKESAPLGVITVMDAISDLPQWEWINPHSRSSSAVSDPETKKRSKHIIQTEANCHPYLTDLKLLGPKDSKFMSYAKAPQNRYQSWIRGDLTKVSQHWCPNFLLEDIERICSLPLTANHPIDHNDLPEGLRLKGYGKPACNGYFGRLDGKGTFTTMVGNLTLNSSNGRIIHPYLHRVITIREMARAQGIPDSVTFQLAERVRGIKSLTKQIGNAVPVPMAAAIGKELLKAEHRSRNSKARRHESVEL